MGCSSSSPTPPTVIAVDITDEHAETTKSEETLAVMRPQRTLTVTNDASRSFGISGEYHVHSGFKVFNLSPGGLAAAAGVKLGDTIVAVDAIAIRSQDALFAQFRKIPDGQLVTFTLLADGQSGASDGQSSAPDTLQAQSPPASTDTVPTDAEVVAAETLNGDHLCDAALAGDLQTVRQLLEAGTPIDYPDSSNQRTPLIKAAMKGHTEVVRMLLDHGAMPSCKDSAGRTALDWAKRHGHTSTAEVIRDPQAVIADASYPRAVVADASVPPAKTGMDLCDAALAGDLPTASRLLEGGVQADFSDPANQRTPLIKAAMKGHAEMLRLLLDHGATWSQRDASGKTALEWAIKQGNEAAIATLEAAGAVVDLEFAATQSEKQAQKTQEMQQHLKEQLKEQRAEEMIEWLTKPQPAMNGQATFLMLQSADAAMGAGA